MNKLKKLEEKFFSMYPDGFDAPEWKEHSKKHKLWEMHRLFLSELGKNRFFDADHVMDQTPKIVSKASLVSVFEKVRFRDFLKKLHKMDKIILTNIIYELLYGSQETGFGQMVDFLEQEKLAKWPLITILPTYKDLLNEVFVKPTTAKKIIKFFDRDDLHYTPRPRFDFYQKYRDFIHELRDQANEKITRSNPEFLGFLMISIDLIR